MFLTVGGGITHGRRAARARTESGPGAQRMKAHCDRIIRTIRHETSSSRTAHIDTHADPVKHETNSGRTEIRTRSG
jgi:hypothetical protein